jgi:8-oxo-dGTP pyrophosphatase MutT (NUDIX family)
MVVAQQAGKYVVLERIRQPFIGAVEWPAGAIVHGESMLVATKRILFERLGITGTPTFVGLFRRIDLYKDAVFDDKLFALHSFMVPAGVALQEEGLTGKNRFCSREELFELKTPSKSLIDIFTFVASGAAGIEEHVYQLQPEDLFLD